MFEKWDIYRECPLEPRNLKVSSLNLIWTNFLNLWGQESHQPSYLPSNVICHHLWLFISFCLNEHLYKLGSDKNVLSVLQTLTHVNLILPLRGGCNN